MRCPKHQKPFYAAFYGEEPPESLYRMVHKVFEGMIERFTKDLDAQFPKISQQTMNDGLLAGLSALHDEGAERPTVYGSHEHLTAVAFKAACAKIRNILKVIEDKKRAEQYRLVEDEEYLEMIERNQTLKANLMIELEGYIKVVIADGVEGIDATIYGFVQLLEKYPDIDGYFYGLLGMIIPLKLDIWWDDRVVDAMNAHPSLRSMKRTRGKPGPLAGIVGGVAHDR